MNTKMITRGIYKLGFKLKKASPEIALGLGVVGVVVSTVMACKASTKFNDVIEEHNDKMEKIHEVTETYSDEYSQEDTKKDTVIVYTQTGIQLVKLYGPSIALGTLSLASIIFGHRILCKRNAAIAAAYTAVSESFRKYRGNVIERFGDKVDKELRYGIKAKAVEEITQNEDGTTDISSQIVEVTDPNFYSDYARFFDGGCAGWTKDPEMNLMFLKKQQAWANERLQRQGYLLLNDVYDALGIPKSKAGFVVGWVYDKKHPIGDNYIDFGIYDINIAKNRDFVNGYERSILLDFNVDGNIVEMM